jgi:RNA methyltransferase, TrmH family
LKDFESVISSRKNPLVLYFIKLQEDRAFRKSQGLVLLEGKNCVLDLLKAKKGRRLIIEEEEPLPECSHCKEVIRVTSSVMKKISGVESPSGMLLEVELPKEENLAHFSRILALDHLQDPGNVGTILRTACALGWEGIFFIEPCCDPFGQKALRAAKGATFSIAYASGSYVELLDLQKRGGFSLAVADLQGKPPEEFSKIKKIILIIGNEGQGVVLPEPAPPHDCITIPMSGHVESLNAAISAAILMYQLRQKKT